MQKLLGPLPYAQLCHKLPHCVKCTGRHRTEQCYQPTNILSKCCHCLKANLGKKQNIQTQETTWTQKPNNTSITSSSSICLKDTGKQNLTASTVKQLWGKILCSRRKTNKWMKHYDSQLHKISHSTSGQYS